MGLRLKLVLIVTFVAIAPVAVSGAMAFRVHQRALDKAVAELFAKTAELGATVAQKYFENAKSSLLLTTRSVRWEQLSASERRGALGLVYRQLDDVAAAALLDENGEGLGASVYVDANETDKYLMRHPPASLAMLQQFARHIPFAVAQAVGIAAGESFTAAGANATQIPLAFRVDGPHGAKWIVALAVSLRSLCADLSTGVSRDFTIHLIDNHGHDLCEALPAGKSSDVAPSLAQIADAGQRLVFREKSSQGGENLVAYAPSANGWGLVAEQPVAVAFAPSRVLLLQTVFWIGVSLLIALVVGMFLAQAIIGPVGQLVKGAQALSGGDFAYRLTVTGRDELGKLGETFNSMGQEVGRRDAEIRAWNLELQKRVDDRTRELVEAQNQLLESQKIAAVTALGAGFAHEINNPLSAVLGMTQILLRRLKKQPDRADDVQALDTIQTEAQRIRTIVRTLHSLSQEQDKEGFAPVDMNTLLDAVLRADESLAVKNIVVQKNLAKDLPFVIGVASELRQAVVHLLDNSKIAMAGGGQLTVSTSSIENQMVRITVADTGSGIAPEILDKIFEPFFTTKAHWRGKGLGLTAVYSVIEKHHGRIKVASKVGEGTTMTITLPAARTGAHLV